MCLKQYHMENLVWRYLWRSSEYNFGNIILAVITQAWPGVHCTKMPCFLARSGKSAVQEMIPQGSGHGSPLSGKE